MDIKNLLCTRAHDDDTILIDEFPKSPISVEPTSSCWSTYSASSASTSNSPSSCYSSLPSTPSSPTTPTVAAPMRPVLRQPTPHHHHSVQHHHPYARPSSASTNGSTGSNGSSRVTSSATGSSRHTTQTRTPWTAEEDYLLQQGYAQGLSWAMISATYLPHRSRGCCWGRFKTLQTKALEQREWTNTEERMLILAIKKHSHLFNEAWKSVAQDMGDRSWKECEFRSAKITSMIRKKQNPSSAKHL